MALAVVADGMGGHTGGALAAAGDPYGQHQPRAVFRAQRVAQGDQEFLDFIYSELRSRNYIRLEIYKVLRQNDQEKNKKNNK